MVRTVLVAAVYVALLATTFGAALDSFIFDMSPKNGCRVFHADEYGDVGIRAAVTETAIAADIPFMSNVERGDGRITKSTAPYDGNPCDEAALDGYRTDEFVLVSYGSTGGSLSLATLALGASASATLLLGWQAARLIVTGVVWLARRGRRAPTGRV